MRQIGSNADRHPNLVPADRGDTLVATNVTPDGCAVALWASTVDAESLRGRSFESGVWFAKVLLDEPVRVRVTTQTRSGDVLSHGEISDFRLAHPHVAAMPGGGWLLAGSRCRWTPGCVDPNATVYSSTGEALRCGVLGDGIGQVGTTATGDIWVGYRDEGIFGNFGWGGPGPEPVGSPGPVRFNSQLERTWALPWTGYVIDDCPAITIDHEDVWATFFPHYPIVHITDGKVAAWTNPTGPTRAVLVDARRRLALVGRSTTIGDLRVDGFHPTASATTPLLKATRERPVQTFALGPTLHAFGPEGAWWTTDVDTLFTAASP